jgi:hypothetical protein
MKLQDIQRLLGKFISIIEIGILREKPEPGVGFQEPLARDLRHIFSLPFLTGDSMVERAR